MDQENSKSGTKRDCTVATDRATYSIKIQPFDGRVISPDRDIILNIRGATYLMSEVGSRPVNYRDLRLIAENALKGEMEFYHGVAGRFDGRIPRINKTLEFE